MRIYRAVPRDVRMIWPECKGADRAHRWNSPLTHSGYRRDSWRVSGNGGWIILRTARFHEQYCSGVSCTGNLVGMAEPGNEPAVSDPLLESQRYRG